MPIYDGISGEIGSLIIDETFVDAHVDLPIDNIVINLTNEIVEDNNIGKVEVVYDIRGRLVF